MPRLDMRSVLPLHVGLFVLFLAFGSAGCSSSSGGGNGNDGGGEDAGGDANIDVSLDTPTEDTDDAGPPRNCTPGTSRCLGDDLAEVCNTNSQWETSQCGDNQVCWGGSCGDLGTCEPSAVDECVGFTRYQGCNPVGTGEGEFDVPFNLTCVDSELVPRTCLAGETLCDDEQVLTACAESGLEYDFATNCFEDDNTTLCDDGACITVCEFIEKLDTYVGCEYWAVDLDNAFEFPNDAFSAQFAVAISNPGETLTADVTIETIDEVLATGSVEPGDMVVFRLPPARIDGTSRGFEAYRVSSTVPIVAYQFNPLENEEVFSNDASILFPSSSLGTEYWVMTRRQLAQQFHSVVTIVATQPGDTAVTVTLPERTASNPVVTLASNDLNSYQGGESFDVTLSQFEVLNIESGKLAADLTGTRVEATRPVAVFGNAELGSAPDTDSCVNRRARCEDDSECRRSCINGRCEDDWVCAWDRSENNTPLPNPPTGLRGSDCWDSTREEPNIDLCLPFWTCCGDHIEQQMLPVFAWGREFNATRAWPRCSDQWPHVCGHNREKDEECTTMGTQTCRTEGDVWRIMAGSNNTQITLVGLPDDIPAPGPGQDYLYEPVRRQWTGDNAIDEGEWIEFQSFSDFEILADGPIFVGHFLVGLHTPGESAPPVNDPMNGDPAFIMQVPREQYRSDYIFLVPAEYAFNFVTIDAPVGVDVHHVDEVLLANETSETYTADRFEPFGSEDYGVLRIQLENEGYHRLFADEPFGVIVHGYDDDVSYGYPAGLDLKEINR